MSTALAIYLYLTLSNLVGVALIFSAFGAAIFIAIWIVACDRENGEDVEKWCARHIKKVLATVIILGVLNVMIPSRSDLAWIIGGSAAYTTLTSDEAARLPDNVLKAANSFLEGVAEKGAHHD